MFGKCCTICEKDVPRSSGSQSQTPKKQLIMMVSRKNRRRNPPHEITYHDEPSINVTNPQYSHQLSASNDRHGPGVNDISFVTSKYKVSNVEQKKVNTSFMSDYLPPPQRNIKIEQSNGGYFTSRKATSLYRSNQVKIPEKLNVEQDYNQFKESNIVEIHSPRRDALKSHRTSSVTARKTNKPFQQINMMKDTQSSFFTQGQLPEDLKIGCLLGKGKYCHVYMCQEKKSNYLFGLKHIFKQSELMTPLFMSVYSSLNFLMNIDHSSIASVYKTVEDKDKISVFQEYLPTLLYDELMSKKRLSIETIRRYLKQIIEAVVILHENNRFHGNLTPLQIGCNMEVCKVRVSITTIASKHPQYLRDIHYIGLLGYQMGHGLYRNTEDNSIYLNDFEYYSHPQFRANIIREILQKSSNSLLQSHYNSILMYLLQQKDNIRISGSTCLTHPFFDEQ